TSTARPPRVRALPRNRGPDLRRRDQRAQTPSSEVNTALSRRLPPIGFSLFRSKVGLGFPARSPAYRLGLYALLAARRARSTALGIRAIPAGRKQPLPSRRSMFVNLPTLAAGPHKRRHRAPHEPARQGSG